MKMIHIHRDTLDPNCKWDDHYCGWARNHYPFDAGHQIHIRAGFEGLPESEWTASEFFIAGWNQAADLYGRPRVRTR